MAATERTRVGVIGCGVISGIYIENLIRLRVIKVAACADIDRMRAVSRAREFGIPSASSPDSLLADPAIEIVVNLTPPAVHASVTAAALEAGKCVYSEKPLAVEREAARGLLTAAAASNTRLGCAPDTFLGAGLQTCRRVIDAGTIGEPLAAAAFMASRGHESWHPNPAFYYQVGGGPLFDMGPYYLTALVSLLGPIRRVTGSGRVSFAERLIESQPNRGDRICVDVPTHVAGVLDFATGPVVSLIMSFDVSASGLPSLEIYGSEGTLQLPHPGSFGGPVRIRKARGGRWRALRIAGPFRENSRGIGVADMAYALRRNRPHRANAEMAFHVLDAMQALHESSVTDRHITLGSSCRRPEVLPPGVDESVLV